MKFVLTLTMALIMSFGASADEIKICDITADIDPNLGFLTLELVDGRADSIRVVSTRDQKILGDDSFPIEQVMSEEGIVATERSGHDIVVLKLENFDPAKGGIVVMNYLFNALVNKRKNFKFKFYKEGNLFVLRTLEGEPVNSVHFIGNRIFGKVVGLKRIQASFK